MTLVFLCGAKAQERNSMVEIIRSFFIIVYYFLKVELFADAG
jgi:hypothetical protein